MTHTIHNFQQGTPEWHAYRQSHFNASEAAAMLGMSSYQTRSDLLKVKATGLTPEVNAQTQKRFDAGHEAEASARFYAEEIIEQDLYPITASRHVLMGSTLLPLSASYDGATMGEDVVWEHKWLSQYLADNLADGEGAIPPEYHPQLEQQLLVIGAEKALFMASTGDATGMACIWYTSNLQLRQRLLAGWAQFADDLANYQHTPAADPAPVGRTPETLPALHIEVTGMVTASNMASFKSHALAMFAGIKRELVTDQDFADAEATVKSCAEIETRLDAAKQHALSQTASIDELFKTIDDIAAESKRTRLELDKLVKNRKDSIRAEIVSDGRNALADHVDALIERIGGRYLPSIPVDFAGAIKGKRTLDSMRDAVATELARAKIEANEVADRITLNLRTLNEKPELAFLFADVAQLVLKAPDDLSAVVQNRIMAHQAAEAERIAAETARIAEQERIKAEAKARQELADQAIEAELAKAQIAAMAAQSVSEITQAMTKKNEVAPTLPIQERGLNFQQYMAAIGPVATPGVAPKEAAHEAPTLKLGQINERLAPISLTADGLASLGFPFVATDKSAKLYRESDFGLICAALVQHINSARLLQAA